MAYKFEKYSIGGGGGSGIIDVTELPTENIDQNAVYRVTKEIAPELWIINDGQKINWRELAAEQGTIDIYVVDALPDTMVPPSDNVLTIYVIAYTGVGYVSQDGTSATAATVGLMLFGVEGIDRGWAVDMDSIDATIPENAGVYCVRGETIITYNTYSNGSWNTYVDGEPLRNEIATLEATVSEKTASANFTDYAVLSGSANGISVTGITDVNIASIKIPSGVTSIGSKCFSECRSLTDITLSDGVTRIGSYAFEQCRGLTSITIPDSVTSIGDHAFYVCMGLTNITIPAGVTSIGDSTFHLCESLASVTIPNSVTSIGDSAFGYCPLTSIIFTGTKEQWKAITFGTDWNQETGDYTITCTDGTIAKDGTET